MKTPVPVFSAMEVLERPPVQLSVREDRRADGGSGAEDGRAERQGRSVDSGKGDRHEARGAEPVANSRVVVGLINSRKVGVLWLPPTVVSPCSRNPLTHSPRRWVRLWASRWC